MSSISWPSTSTPRRSQIRDTDWSKRQAVEEVRPAFVDEEIQPVFPADPPFSAPPEPVVPPPEPEFPEPPPQASAPPPEILTNEFDHQIVLLQEALSEVAEAQQREAAKAAEEVLELGLAVAEELAGGAIEVEPKRVLKLINEAFLLLADARALKVRLHPTLYSRMEEAGLLAELDVGGKVAIRPDPGVGDDGCVVESDAGRVDASVRSRLSRLRHLLREGEGMEP